MSGFKILVVDDNKKSVGALRKFFQEREYEVIGASSGKEAIEKASELSDIQVAIIDLVMPVMDGFTLLDEIKETSPNTHVVIAGEDGKVPTVVEAIKRGASDFITKPYDEFLLLKKLSLIRKAQDLEAKLNVLNERLQRNYGFENIVSCSRTMEKVFGKISLAANSNAQIFLLGETGTGKGLLAKAIHQHSNRKNKPFISVNCGAIPKELIEAELFGYEKGSFTGAIRSHPGIFVAADKGTVFLDEIGEMSKEMQVHLLSVLEEKKVRPIGHTDEMPIDVRILAASNRSLEEIKETYLREDLFYRLAVIVIEIPPLRERKEDIPLLVEHFIKIFNEKYSRNVKGVSDEVLRSFYGYDFPGNVRQLENLLEGIIAVSRPKKELITQKDISISTNTIFQRRNPSTRPVLSLKEIEGSILKRALKQSRGNKTQAANILGISRNTLYRKLKQYGIC